MSSREGAILLRVSPLALVVMFTTATLSLPPDVAEPPGATILSRARHAARTTKGFRFSQRLVGSSYYRLTSGTKSARQSWRLRGVYSSAAPGRQRAAGYLRSVVAQGLAGPTFSGPVRTVLVGSVYAWKFGRWRWRCENQGPQPGPRGSFANPIGPLSIPTGLEILRTRRATIRGRSVWVISTRMQAGSVGPRRLPEMSFRARYWVDASTYAIHRVEAATVTRDRRSGRTTNLGHSLLNLTRYGERVRIHLPAACRGAR